MLARVERISPTLRRQIPLLARILPLIPNHVLAGRHSKLISTDVQRAVEDTENVDVIVVAEQIGDAIVPVMQDSDRAH